jgi:hypothetical protein
MSSGITVSIKFELKCVKDYILEMYGPEPIQLNRTNISSLFVTRLSKPPMGFNPAAKQSHEYLLFELPFNDIVNIRYNFFINEKNQRQIANYFKSELKEQFRRFMNENLLSEFKLQKECVNAFTRYYNIDCSQSTFDLLVKDDYRIRKKLKKPLLKVRGLKTYKKPILKRNISTTSGDGLSLKCP